MKNRLIPAMTAFIATIGQTCRTALKTVSVRLAVRFSGRKRSPRVCSSEYTSRADPAQPRAWTTHVVMGEVWGKGGLRRSLGGGRLALLGLDVGADRIHVEGLHLADDVLEHRRGERPGLREHEDAVTEPHEHRDRGDVGGGREGLLGLG